MGYWYLEIEDESWGQCPALEFCDVLECENVLNAIVIVDTSLYDFSEISVRMTGPWWNWDPQGGPIANWVEFWDPEDAEFFGVGGFFHVGLSPIPGEDMEYLWVVNGVQENFLDENHAYWNGFNSEDISCLEITDYENYANRLWKTDYCEDNNECGFADIYEIPCAFDEDDDGEEQQIGLFI